MGQTCLQFQCTLIVPHSLITSKQMICQKRETNPQVICAVRSQTIKKLSIAIVYFLSDFLLENYIKTDSLSCLIMGMFFS